MLCGSSSALKGLGSWRWEQDGSVSISPASQSLIQYSFNLMKELNRMKL